MNIPSRIYLTLTDIQYMAKWTKVPSATVFIVVKLLFVYQYPLIIPTALCPGARHFTPKCTREAALPQPLCCFQPVMCHVGYYGDNNKRVYLC